jgi:hypothetical protein
MRYLGLKIPGCDFQIRADIISQSALRRVKLGKSGTKTGAEPATLNEVGILETKGPFIQQHRPSSPCLLQTIHSPWSKQQQTTQHWKSSCNEPSCRCADSPVILNANSPSLKTVRSCPSCLLTVRFRFRCLFDRPSPYKSRKEIEEKCAVCSSRTTGWRIWINSGWRGSPPLELAVTL